jgi:hypothetical protein
MNFREKVINREPCHACGSIMRFELDMDLDGKHVINCPVCGHEHCRIIKNGNITSDRWDQRNQTNYQIFYIAVSIGTSLSTSSSYALDSWNQTTVAY